MKKQILNIVAVAALIFTTSCNDKAKEAETNEAETVAKTEESAVAYKTDTANSTIEWKGFKPTGSHNGTIAIANGTVNVSDGKLESGDFLIDMNTITVTDIPAEEKGNAKLKGHLTSADFFDVATFPDAKFEITGVETIDNKTMLSGNLRLKDAINNVTFPVTTSMDGDNMTLTSETFTIDRSKWNVKHGSKSFFDDLGDKFINDDIELKVNLVATKS